MAAPAGLRRRARPMHRWRRGGLGAVVVRGAAGGRGGCPRHAETVGDGLVLGANLLELLDSPSSPIHMNQQHDCGQENQDGEHSAPTRPAEQPLSLGPRVGGQILVLVAHEGPCEADGLYIGGGRQVGQDLQAFVELPEQPFIAGDDLRRDYQERGVGSQGRPRGGAGGSARSVAAGLDRTDDLVPVREVPEELAEVALQAPHPEDGIRFGRQVGRAVVHNMAAHGLGLCIGRQVPRAHRREALDSAGSSHLQRCPAAPVGIPAPPAPCGRYGREQAGDRVTTTLNSSSIRRVSIGGTSSDSSMLTSTLLINSQSVERPSSAAKCSVTTWMRWRTPHQDCSQSIDHFLT